MESADKMSQRHTRNIEPTRALVVKYKTIKIVTSIDARMPVTGKYSGQKYLFNGAGSTQDVDERDVDWLLAKRQGTRQCCGGNAEGNVVFHLV